jgi:hypothetical protein
MMYTDGGQCDVGLEERCNSMIGMKFILTLQSLRMCLCAAIPAAIKEVSADVISYMAATTIEMPLELGSYVCFLYANTIRLRPKGDHARHRDTG